MSDTDKRMHGSGPREPDFDTPEAAAMMGFPPRYCRVIATRVEGDDAYVLLDTGSPGQPYLYGVNCRRRDGRWFEGSSGNGSGWSVTDPDRDLGTWSLWDDAPPDADMVRVEFNGQIVEQPIENGAYLVAWFNQPYGDGPEVVAFRIRGQWADGSLRMLWPRGGDLE